MVFTEFKNTIKQSRVIIILNKKSGSRIWYSLYKEWESVSSLHYDMHFMAVKEKEQSDKQSSLISTPKTASIFPSYTLYSKTHLRALLHRTPISKCSHRSMLGFVWSLKCARIMVIDSVYKCNELIPFHQHQQHFGNPNKKVCDSIFKLNYMYWI